MRLKYMWRQRAMIDAKEVLEEIFEDFEFDVDNDEHNESVDVVDT